MLLRTRAAPDLKGRDSQSDAGQQNCEPGKADWLRRGKLSGAENKFGKMLVAGTSGGKGFAAGGQHDGTVLWSRPDDADRYNSVLPT
jgi:hypothetical protein